MISAVDSYLEAILNHLRCSIMFQPPIGEPTKCYFFCMIFHLFKSKKKYM